MTALGETNSRGRLAVFGAGGHGRVVADAAEAAGWREIVFYDDAAASLTHGPWKVAGDFAALKADAEGFDGVIVAIGHNRRRLALFGELATLGAAMVSIVHPAAIVSRHASLAAGVFVAAGAVINIGSAIGAGTIVNTGATVDHDCNIAASAHIAPGAHLSGGAMVGTCSWVGVGAAVKELVAIGEDCMVGAGSVVIRPVDDGLTVIGNPARPLSKD